MGRLSQIANRLDAHANELVDELLVASNADALRKIAEELRSMDDDAPPSDQFPVTRESLVDWSQPIELQWLGKCDNRWCEVTEVEETGPEDFYGDGFRVICEQGCFYFYKDGKHKRAPEEIRVRNKQPTASEPAVSASDWHDGDKPKDGAPGYYAVRVNECNFTFRAYDGESWLYANRDGELIPSQPVYSVGTRIAPHHAWPAIPEPKPEHAPLRRGRCKTLDGKQRTFVELLDCVVTSTDDPKIGNTWCKSAFENQFCNIVYED